MLRKLRTKFVCIIMAIVTVMLCIIFVTVYGFTAKTLELTSLQKMESVANRSSFLAMGNAFASGSYIVISTNQQGDWLVQTSGNFSGIDDREYFIHILELAQADGNTSGVLSQYNLRFLVETSPRRQIVVFADASAELTTLKLLVQVGLVIGSIGLLIFLFISILLARVAVQPVEKAWKQQTQFVADASHELKTPLTVIMTNAELLQDPDYPPESRSRFSENILVMSRQMRGLVNSLLELARVDNGAIKTTFSPLNFSETVLDAILPFDPLYFERGLQVQSRVESGIYVRGSIPHLRQVIEILLDNAMKYSKPGVVEITLKRSAAHCTLCVANPGDPIPPQELAHLFERFYRADKSRSRDGSYGLGLSIAQRIVLEHHGKIWAESSGGSNRFCFTLPTTFRPSENSENLH